MWEGVMKMILFNPVIYHTFILLVYSLVRYITLYYYYRGV